MRKLRRRFYESDGGTVYEWRLRDRLTDFSLGFALGVGLYALFS